MPGMAPSGDGRPALRSNRSAKSPLKAMDVTRLELENVYAEIDALTKSIGRIEAGLQRLTERVARMERRGD